MSYNICRGIIIFVRELKKKKFLTPINTFRGGSCELRFDTNTGAATILVDVQNVYIIFQHLIVTIVCSRRSIIRKTG